MRNEVSAPKVVNLTFTLGRHGRCELQLVVKDNLGTASEPDTVIISTLDTTPVAHAGSDQVIKAVGTPVALNGAHSYDPDGDILTYQWVFISRPAESAAYLKDAGTAGPTFVADAPGDYTIQTQAFTTQTNTITALQGMETEIAELDSSAFRNDDMQNVLLNKLNAVIANVEAGNNADASNQLRNDILPKMGSAGNTAGDSAAWVIDRSSQQAWYLEAQDVVRTLEMAQ